MEHGVDDCHVLPPVVVNVVALVLGLDHEPSVRAEEPLALLLVVGESLPDVADGNVGMQFGVHSRFSVFISLPNERYFSSESFIFRLLSLIFL